MVLPDSSPEKWVMREHTRVKLELLEKYLLGWIRILGRWHTRILFVDGFAGRGQYTEGDGKITDGSPIRALRVGHDFSGEFVAIFVEKNQDNYVNLRKTLDAVKMNYPNVQVSIKHDDFENVVDGILDKIDKEGAKLAPAFFFVDPFGFSGVPFPTIKRILSKPQSEIFFTFMSRDMNRFLSNPSHQIALKQLFGTDECLKLADLPEETRQESLVSLYRTQLMKEAGASFVWPFRVSHTEKREVIYHLLHASNHFKALMLMKTIMYNQGAAGTFTYFGPDERELGSSQARLQDSDLAGLKQMLLDKFKGQARSFDSLMEETWDSPYIEKHYRAVIQEMRRDKLVKVTPVSSRTEKGLQQADIVHFP
jgi:three-Cys-motif partner protein